jgi:hypothetical protein
MLELCVKLLFLIHQYQSFINSIFNKHFKLYEKEKDFFIKF